MWPQTAKKTFNTGYEIFDCLFQLEHPVHLLLLQARRPTMPECIDNSLRLAKCRTPQVLGLLSYNSLFLYHQGCQQKCVAMVGWGILPTEYDQPQSVLWDCHLGYFACYFPYATGDLLHLLLGSFFYFFCNGRETSSEQQLQAPSIPPFLDYPGKPSISELTEPCRFSAFWGLETYSIGRGQWKCDWA